MSDFKNEYKSFCSDISNESYIGKLMHSNRYDLEDTNTFDSQLSASDARKYISYAYVISDDDTSFLNSNYKKEINDLLKRALVFCSEGNDYDYVEAVLFYNSVVMFKGTKSQKSSALNKLINLKTAYGTDSDKPLKLNAWTSLNLILSNYFYKNEDYIDYIQSLNEGIVKRDNSNQGCSIFIDYVHDLYKKLKTDKEECRNLSLAYAEVLRYMNSTNKKVFRDKIIEDTISKKLSPIEGLYSLSALALSYNPICRRRVYSVDEYENDIKILFDAGLINNIDILEEYAEHGKYANDISYFKRKDLGAKSLKMVIDNKVTLEDVDRYFEEITIRYPVYTYGGNTEIDEFFGAMSEILLSSSQSKDLNIGYLKFATKYTIGHPDNPLNVATTFNVRKNERFLHYDEKSGGDPYNVFTTASAFYAQNMLSYDEYLDSMKSLINADFSNSKSKTGAGMKVLGDAISMEITFNPNNMDLKKKLSLLPIYDETTDSSKIMQLEYMMGTLFDEYEKNEDSVSAKTMLGYISKYMKNPSFTDNGKDTVNFLKESYMKGDLSKDDVMYYLTNSSIAFKSVYEEEIEKFFNEGDKKTNPAAIPTTTPQKSSEDKKEEKTEEKTEDGVSSKDTTTSPSSSSSSSNPQSDAEKANEEKFNEAYKIASGNSGNWHSRIVNYRYEGNTVNGGKNVVVDIIGDYGWTNNNIQKIKYSGGSLAKPNNVPYCLVTEYQQLYNASISNILTSIVGILEGGKQLSNNVFNMGSTAIESLIGTFGKMMIQVNGGSVAGNGGGLEGSPLSVKDKQADSSGGSGGTSGSGGTGGTSGSGGTGGKARAGEGDGGGNAGSGGTSGSGSSGGTGGTGGSGSSGNQGSTTPATSGASVTEGGNTTVVGKVSSAISSSVGWIKSLFTDAMSKINLGQSPATNSSLLAPYRLMYIVNPTGKKYCFPMLDKSSSSFRVSNKMDETDGGEGSKILGNKLFSTIANVGRSILGLAQDVQQIAPFFDKGSSSGGIKQYHIERSKYFSYPTDGEEIETNFILYNTVKKDIWKKHYRFILGFMLRNLPYKQDVVSYYPPLFYDVIVPGVKRCPFCYVESFDVSPLGITRTIRISKREIGLDNSGSNEYYSVNVPEAWMIKIKFKSLLGTSANQILSGLVDAPITTSAK